MDICLHYPIYLQVIVIKYRDTFIFTSYILEKSTKGLLKYLYPCQAKIPSKIDICSEYHVLKPYEIKTTKTNTRQKLIK